MKGKTNQIDVVLWAPILYPWMMDFVGELINDGLKIQVFHIRANKSYPSIVSKTFKPVSYKKDEIQTTEIKALQFIGEILPSITFYYKILSIKPKNIIIFASETIGSIFLTLISYLLGSNIIIIVEQNVDQRKYQPALIKSIVTIKKILARLSHNAANHLIAESNLNKSYLKNELKCVNENIHTIPHGVDTNRFFPKIPVFDEVSILNNNNKATKLNVLFAGGLFKHKGIDVVIDAINKLENRDIDFIIINYGNPYYSAILSKYPNVFLIPPVDQNAIADLFSEIDVVIIPSIKSYVEEVSPNILLEAMACGKAVIASNIGGIPDVLGDCGILIPDEDSDALCAGINQYYYNRQLVINHGEMSQTRIEKQLSIKSYARSIEKLFS